MISAVFITYQLLEHLLILLKFKVKFRKSLQNSPQIGLDAHFDFTAVGVQLAYFLSEFHKHIQLFSPIVHNIIEKLYFLLEFLVVIFKIIHKRLLGVYFFNKRLVHFHVVIAHACFDVEPEDVEAGEVLLHVIPPLLILLASSWCNLL